MTDQPESRMRKRARQALAIRRGCYADEECACGQMTGRNPDCERCEMAQEITELRTALHDILEIGRAAPISAKGDDAKVDAAEVILLVTEGGDTRGVVLFTREYLSQVASEIIAEIDEDGSITGRRKEHWRDLIRGRLLRVKEHTSNVDAIMTDARQPKFHDVAEARMFLEKATDRADKAEAVIRLGQQWARWYALSVESDESAISMAHASARLSLINALGRYGADQGARAGGPQTAQG